MPLTRKDLILNAIQNYTSKAIVEQNFDFSNCNAHILSLDLHIDRTNISRILNQLFTEGELIKTSGRPTLYISKKIIEDNYPFLEIPSTLKKEEKLQDYLYHDHPIHKEELSDIIGAKKNGSLYKTISSILPMISRRNNQLFLFSLSGPSGSGKKYIVESMFQYAKKYQKLEKKDSIFLISYSLILRNPDFILNAINTEIHKWIIIEIFNEYDEGIITSLLTELTDLYFNKNHILNAIAIIFHNNDKKVFSLSTYFSYDYEIPSIQDRPIDETVSLILNLFLSNAVLFNREIRIPRYYLNKFIQYVQNENIEKLSRVIYSVVSLCFYHASKNLKVPLQLEDTMLPNQIKYITENQSLTQYLLKLPDFIEITPSSHINNIIQKKVENINLNTASEYKYNLQYTILNTSSNFTNLSEISSNPSELRDKIFNVFKKTNLITDIFMFLFIVDTIQKFIDNRVSIQKFKITNSKPIKPTTQNLIDSVLKIISNSSPQMFHLMESEKYIIAQLINECILMTNEVSTPILIITHSSHMSENYAHQFNILAKKRVFYSIEFSDISENKNIEYLKMRLYSVISLLNRGKGIYMLADQKQITKLGSNMFTHTKVPVFLFTFGSLSVFLDLITQIDTTHMSSITFSKLITKSARTSRIFVQSDTLRNVNIRENNTYLNTMAQIFPSINTKITNNLLYLSLESICDQLHIHMTNSLIIDYIFHGNCLLNRIIINKEHFSLEREEDKEVFQIILQSLQSFYQFKDIVFESGDIEVLYQSLFSQIKSNQDY